MKKTNPAHLLQLLLCFLLFSSALTAQNKPDTTRFANGSYETGKLKNGKREGTWTLYDNNGNKLAATSYAAGQKHGSFTRYQDGTIVEKGQFAHDDSAGTWNTYNANGKKLESRMYKGGIRSGIAYRWNEDGIVTRKIYYTSPANFEAVEFYPSGHKRADTRYVNGMKEGRAVTYNDFTSGYDSLSSISEYHQDSLNGVEEYYFMGMKTSETHYSHGKREGMYIKYDNTGRYVRTVEYHNDEMDGVARDYSNGKLVRETNYLQGKQSGKCIYFTAGIKTTEQWWANGRLDSSYTYSLENPATITCKIVRLYTAKDSTVYAQRLYYTNGKLRSELLGSKISATALENVSSYRYWNPNGKLAVSGISSSYKSLSSLQAWDDNGNTISPGTDTFDEWVVMHIDTGMSFLATSPVDSAFMPRYERFAGATDPKDCKVYVAPQKFAEFPGGEPAFFSYLSTQIRYPIIEKENNRQGIVYISFVVRRDGKICFVQSVKEVPNAPGLTKEAIRVIQGMPDWKPGVVNGHAVNSIITQPIKFVLQ